MCTYYSQWPVKLGVFMYNIARYKLVTRWCHYGLVNLVSGQKMYIHTVHLTHSSAMQVYTTPPPPPPPPVAETVGTRLLFDYNVPSLALSSPNFYKTTSDEGVNK